MSDPDEAQTIHNDRQETIALRNHEDRGQTRRISGIPVCDDDLPSRDEW